jgi:hypothetical protein
MHSPYAFGGNPDEYTQWYPCVSASRGDFEEPSSLLLKWAALVTPLLTHSSTSYSEFDPPRKKIYIYEKGNKKS